MKALQVTSLSDDLSGLGITELPKPERKAGEVLVEIHAASLNFPDLLMTRGEYQFKPPLPFISGLECAGLVMEADEASRFKPGDWVIGGQKTGGFAQSASIAEASLSPLPRGLSYAQGASLGAAYNTAYTGLVELCALREGQWVLVTGASGGVGLAAIDLAKALGARVIAATGVEAKMEPIKAKSRADHVILSEGRFREQIADLTGGALCDSVFDPVGGSVFDEATRCVRFGGKLVIVGFTSGEISTIAANIPLIKGFSLVGLRAGEYARRFPERGRVISEAIAQLAATEQIAPVIDRVLPLNEWREGFAAMQARELVGKVVFNCQGKVSD